MINWYRVVSADLSKLPDCIDHYEQQLEEARVECGMKGNIELNSSKIPGIVEHRFNQLQEIESILEFLNIQLRKIRSLKYKQYLENYQRALTSRDVEKYVDGEDDVVDLTKIVNDFALIRNQYLGITKGLDQKQWQITNIVKLRVAGMEDADIK